MHFYDLLQISKIFHELIRIFTNFCNFWPSFIKFDQFLWISAIFYVHFHKLLRISSNLYEIQRISTSFYAFLEIFFYDLLRIFKDLRISTRFYGFSRILTNLYKFLWTSTSLYKFFTKNWRPYIHFRFYRFGNVTIYSLKHWRKKTTHLLTFFSTVSCEIILKFEKNIINICGAIRINNFLERKKKIRQ